MQVKFKAKEKGEQPKLFTQLPHRYKYFTKHPLEKQPMVFSFLVRVMGLEPIRRRHTPLKRACLPIPAHSQIFLSYNKKYYNTGGINCQYNFLGFFLTVKFQQQKYILLLGTMYIFDNLGP